MRSLLARLGTYCSLAVLALSVGLTLSQFEQDQPAKSARLISKAGQAGKSGRHNRPLSAGYNLGGRSTGPYRRDLWSDNQEEWIEGTIYAWPSLARQKSSASGARIHTVGGRPVQLESAAPLVGSFSLDPALIESLRTEFEMPLASFASFLISGPGSRSKGEAKNPFSEALKQSEAGSAAAEKGSHETAQAEPAPAKSAEPASEGKESTSESNAAVAAVPMQLLFIGDVNGDGVADLTRGAMIDRQSFALQGLGVSKFGMTVFQRPAEIPRVTVVTDLNGDGVADIVTSQWYSGLISIRLGNNAGKFVEASRLAINANPITMAVGDVDRDGKHEILMAVENGLAAIYSQVRGDLSFIRTGSIFLPELPSFLAIIDQNRDGAPDIIGGDYLARRAFLLLGSRESKDFAAGGLLELPVAPRFEDLNGDGKLEVLLLSQVGNQLFIGLDSGRGLYHVATIDARSGAYAVVGDLSSTGGIDLAIAVPIR